MQKTIRGHQKSATEAARHIMISWDLSKEKYAQKRLIFFFIIIVIIPYYDSSWVLASWCDLYLSATLNII